MSIANKISSALYKLTSQDFNVTDDTILDKVFCHILNSDTLKEEISLELPEIGDWFEDVIKRWNYKDVSYRVRIFVVRFIGYIGSYNDGFKVLQDKSVLTFIKHLISTPDVRNDTSLMVSLMNASEMILNHQKGWQWITETMILKVVMKIFFEDQSMYTKRAGVKFISQLLTKSKNYDESYCKELLSIICEPLVSNHLLALGSDKSSGEFYDDDDQKLSDITYTYDGNKINVTKEVVIAANYLCYILEDLLLAKNKLPVELSLVYRIVESENVESVLVKDVIENCSSIQDHQIFSQLLLLIDVVHLLNKDSLSCRHICCLRQINYHAQCVIKSLMRLGQLKNVVDFCVLCLIRIEKIKQKMSRFQSDCILCRYHEKTIVQCMIVYLDLHKDNCKISIKNANATYQTYKDDYSFSESLFQAIFVKCISESGKPEKIKYQFMLQGVLGLTRSLNYLKYNISIFNAFEAVQTTLSSLVIHLPKDEVQTKPIILHLLNCISNFLVKHDVLITTKSSEQKLIANIIQVLSTVKGDTRIIVTSLQTITRILKHRILSELRSEKEETPSNTLSILQLCYKTVLKDQLESESWEVRDTTLELFQTVIDVAELMPCFFTEIFQTELLHKILDKATEDESSYVRATALNFFSSVVRCKLFDGIITPNTLLDVAIKILLEDNMPVARISACNLVAALYINYVPEVLNDVDKIYQSVYTAFTKEFHWEVKSAALNFWQCTISKHLMEQRIPHNQFGVQLQIAPLDSQEAVSKIIPVLESLGEIGCLKAIWLGLTDDCDLKVSQEAQSIVESLENINKQWNFLEELMKEENIDEGKHTVESNRRLKPRDFFSQLQKENWGEKIVERQNWIENSCDNLDSLLDDILDDLNRMGDKDHNAVDCY